MRPLIFLFLVSIVTSERTTLHQRNSFPLGWTEESSTSVLDEHIQFSILLKQRNVEKLEELFWKVSDPEDELYGRHLTQERLRELIAPPSMQFEQIESWLRGHDITEMKRGMDHRGCRIYKRDIADVWRRIQKVPSRKRS